MSEIKVTIMKYNPRADAEPYAVTYPVPWKEYLTALEAIHYINENCEPVSFDYSCRAGLCGRCAISLDGNAKLACYATLDESNHTIGPVEGFPVLKDLIVDRSTLYDRLDQARTSVMTTKSLAEADAPVIEYEFWWETLQRLNMCRECGNCISVCPVFSMNKATYAGPAPLSQIGLRMFDGVDQSDRALQATEMGIFQCTLCKTCETVCPSYIEHASLHKMMQDEARKKGYAPQDA